MRKWLSYPTVQIVLCLLAFAGIVYQFGPFGTVIAAPLLAAAIARPVINLVGNVRHGMRERVWLPVHGEHFVFKDSAVRVLEDDELCRWVSVDDARKAAGLQLKDSTLAAWAGPRLRMMGKPARAYLRDDAFLEYLGRSTAPVTLHFRNWLERTVFLPGEKLRKSRGIRPASQDD